MTTTRTTTTTSVPRPTSTTDPQRRATRGVTVAGAAYVTSWLLGLVLAPAAPEPDAPAAQIGAFYAERAAAVLLSSAFVHGTAAIALAAFAAAVARATGATGGLRRAVSGTGLAAAALSLVQVVLAVLAVVRDDTDLRADLFTGINLLDVVKIAALAGFVAVTTTALARAGSASRPLRALAVALVPALVLGSTAFVVVDAALMAVLAGSLLGLLLWTGLTVLAVRRLPG